ncbi:hypothetical protein GCM10009716_21030 [Streptomyces sodiiphilus]|uniref:ABC transporter permease n=1 Tax=Streptomyces sodiiphilus TaxID=226217 RepID=A0ABN2P3M9_9ACTN
MAATVLLGVCEALVRSPEAAAALIRAELIRLGLALTCARLLGRAQAWVLPLLTLFPLTYLGWDPAGTVRWWNWMWAPPQAPACWALAAASLAAAALAHLATPWRLRHLRRTPRPKAVAPDSG